MKFYEREVYLFGIIRLPLERIQIRYDYMKSEQFTILPDVAWYIRPFCKVRFTEVTQQDIYKDTYKPL